MEKSCPHDYSITVFFDFFVINRQQEYFMLRNMMMLLFAILLGYATAGFAGDYVLDASTMGVGATAGENLVVKEGCLDPSKTTCTEKVKWLSAISPTKVGNIQILGQLTGDFEIIITADFIGQAKAVKILTADNKGFSFEFIHESGFGLSPNGIGTGGGCCNIPGWSSGYSFNEVKIVTQQGIAKVYINGQTNEDYPVTFDKNTIFSKVSIEGIKSDDRLSDVKVRGIQGSTTCNSTPTTPSTPTSSGDCTADYTATGSLHVPCVRVPGAFGKTELYDVWMQQKFPSFSFELDMNRVTVK